jgi:diadenosine tetraphosphate (Ap4A) HIT family hydrolase
MTTVQPSVLTQCPEWPSRANQYNTVINRSWRMLCRSVLAISDRIACAIALRPLRVTKRGARNVAAVESDCIFCQQDNTELNHVITKNRTFYARLDNFPATDGHVEIVPKRHVESFFDLTRREMKDAYRLIKGARDHIADSYSPEGYTIGVNEGRAAGRTVDHLHIHLIPRRFGDVEDPRGGIRQVVPNCNPDAWGSATVGIS